MNIYVKVAQNKWKITKMQLVQDTDGILAPFPFSAGANCVTNGDKSFWKGITDTIQ